jgi:hypothetical protein
MTDNDDQPTGMDGEINTTAAVPVSPRTVAAGRYSELPTAIVPDVGLTRSQPVANCSLSAGLKRSRSALAPSHCRPGPGSADGLWFR